MTVHRDKFRIK